MARTHYEKRLEAELQRIVGARGRVIDAAVYEEAKGGGWAVVFDTEYAALKAYYAYRLSPGVHFGKASDGGWYVAIRPDQAILGRR